MSEKIKQYWDERAKENPETVTGTTNDVYLRELEIKTFVRAIAALAAGDGLTVLDIGCGDGYTTINIARHFPDVSFTGVDYSESMVANADRKLEREPATNVTFSVADATRIAETFPAESFDVILTDRCLINLDSDEKQYDSIRQISELLKPGGHYIGIENFMEGQENLTAARASMGLPEIPVRWHNLFFVEHGFTSNVSNWFSQITFDDFSSAYYYTTRVLYSAMCHERGEEPDYQHDIHRRAVDLPPIGKNFSPIRLFVLRKST